MMKYSLRCDWWVDIGPSRLRDEVDERKDQDPDEIDEVPEEPYELHGADASLVVLAEERANQNDRQVANAGEHVTAVEAGDHVERVRVGRVAEDQSLLD